MNNTYDFKKIEAKWQKRWDKEKCFEPFTYRYVYYA